MNTTKTANTAPAAPVSAAGDTGEEAWEAPTRLWNRMFLSIFFANMALNMGQQMSNSLLSLYAKSLGAPADQIGILSSMFAVTALIFRFISGPAMNSFNRRHLLSMAMSFMTVAYLGFSFAPAIGNAMGIDPIEIMKGFRLFQGIGNAFGASCCLTIVSDALPKKQFTTGMGYYACGQVVAQAIGPTIGVFLRDLLGYNLTYIVVACVMITAILISTQVKLAPRKAVPFSLKFSNMIAREALIPASITMMVAMGFTCINSFMLVYTEEREIYGGSFFFTVYAITLLATRPAIGKLCDKYGFVRVAIPAVFMTAVSLVLIGIAPNLYVLLFAAFVNAFGYGAVQPMLQALCMKAVPSERRGSASGTNYIGLDLATILGPSICGIVASAIGYRPLMWCVMTIPILLGMLMVFVFRRQITSIESNFAAKQQE